MGWIETPARGPSTLGTVMVQRDREAENSTLAYESRCPDDVFGRDEVERPGLVLGAPPAPILIAVGELK